MTEERRYYLRRDMDKVCPLTPEEAHRMIDRLDKIEPMICELHQKYVSSKTFIAGARFAGGIILTTVGGAAVFIYMLATGKLSIKEFFSIIF